MSDLDVDQLLKPISAEQPCGADLSYDPEFLELERLIQGTPEREMGEVKIAAEEPDWRDMSRRARALLARSRDIRVIVYLTLAELKLRGAPGFLDGLRLLHRSVETFWPELYPPLDPDDNNDPALRINAIAAMSPQTDVYGDPLAFPERLRTMVLADSKQIGRIRLRDVLIATGELSPRDGETRLEPVAIDAAFKSADSAVLAATAAAIDDAITAWNALDAALTANAGATHAPDLQSTRKILAAIQTVLRTRMGGAGGISTAPAGQSGSDQPAAAAIKSAPAAGSQTVGFVSGVIQSRADCQRAIDDICRYLETTEPSSPVPLLLKRAKRLIDKNFIDVISDLSPDMLAAIKALAGIRDGEQ